MKNDPTSNNVMARVYRTAFAVSALTIFSSLAHAADPPVGRGNVSVNVNPTTSYYSVSNNTLRLPNGVSAAPASGGVPVVTKYPSGLQQTLPTGITIDAVKKTAPLSVSVRAKTPALKSAAKGLFKANLAGLVLGAGLQQLLDGIGALIDDGGKVTRSQFPPDSEQTACYAGSSCWRLRDGSTTSNPNAVCYDSHGYKPEIASAVASVSGAYCDLVGTAGGVYKNQGMGAPRVSTGSLPMQNVPLSSTELDNAVDSSYVPEPSDWKNLTPHLTPDDIEITWAPTLQGEPKTTTEYDADGNPHKIRETNIWYDFDIRDNPSPQPKLDVKTREETKTYEEGVLTGTTTTESTASAGSDDTPQPPPESPIDCDLFPTACAWFEWTKEEPVEPDDDLSPLLQEVPIVSETYTITGGVAACPAPLVLDLSVFGSREVSYQPLCDLASTMKFLYLALMSFAAAVLLNRSINRV